MGMGLYRKIVSLMASALRYTELHLDSVFLEHDVINPSRDLSRSKGRGAGQKGVGELISGRWWWANQINTHVALIAKRILPR